MFFHNNPTIEELPAQTVCETLAASLLYPVVIISRDGFIVYKNDSMKKSECRWRIGASLKYYIGNTLAENVLSTKPGDYKAFKVDEKSVAALRLDDYFFLVFLPYLHMNEAHISVLYRYMTSIPEKEFFDIHPLSAPETFSETENKKWNSFKKKYQNFYQKRYPYLEETHKLYVKETSESRHELYDILRTLAKVVNNRKHLIGCEILFKQQNIWDDFWFKCRSEDMGVLMSMVLYLCMMFSDSSRTKIEINMERFSFEDISRVSFSFKNSMSEKEVEKIFLAKEYYGYNVAVIDLRNPTKSDGNNLLHLVNKYMDLWKKEPDNLAYKAKAEKYAKIISNVQTNIWLRYIFFLPKKACGTYQKDLLV